MFLEVSDEDASRKGSCGPGGGDDGCLVDAWRCAVKTPLVRAWVVTVKFKDDPAGYRTMTTRVYGSNPTDAEMNYLREHPDVSAVVFHHESYA
jgi:hypothetical protein